MQEDFMNTIGVLLLAAATATTGWGKPFANKGWLRGHVVESGPAPGQMIQPGPGGPGGPQAGRRFPNTRSQINFVEPRGMKIGWQTTTGNGEKLYLPAQLTVPARYNFNQGYIYRLKLTDLPGRPNLALYPSIEVAPSSPATDAYLSHNPIPAQFTEEDFDQVTAGNFVTKVVYLPDPKYQELAISGVETLVSTRLEPGVDPILEADRRGTILMIIRLGGINLEMPSSGVSDIGQPGTPGMSETTGVDTAPVSPIVPGGGPFTPSPAPAPGTDAPTTPPMPAPTTPPPGGDVPAPGGGH
jgi:hypothetical protein